MNRAKTEFVHSNGDKLHARTSRNTVYGEADLDSHSRMSTTSSPADEAEAYSLQRMLQDSTGRLREYESVSFTESCGQDCIQIK
jgi:hypothetical protein